MAKKKTHSVVGMMGEAVNWRARDDSNTRTLPQEPPPHPNRAKSGPLPLAGVSSIEADRRP
jgi:hypothetical protein